MRFYGDKIQACCFISYFTFYGECRLEKVAGRARVGNMVNR